MEIAADVQAILNCLPDSAILLSRDYRILMANEAYRDMYGDGAPLRRRRCYEVSHRYTVPCDLAGEQCPLKQSRETGQASKVLHVHHTPRGQEYVNVETRPVKDSTGEIVYFIEIIRPSDIAHARGDGEGMVGRSRTFRHMLDQVDRVAPADTSVLLLGESGTGKELIARTIHERSRRAGGPFVPVECTGLPESLFESELFGHVKGAFTGATSEKTGLVESADGGTLFLDEVGDIPLSDQVKLLRLLETRCFRRVGSTETRQADFRLVCATNKDLAERVKSGDFREDLYYRINVFDIQLPPLRNRREDLKPLIKSIISQLRPGDDMRISDDALAIVSRYDFPGNVRELRNTIERAMLMCDGQEILPRHLPSRLSDGRERDADDAREIRSLDAVERRYLSRVLSEYDGDRKSLAKKLGISERALYRKISQLRKHR